MTAQSIGGGATGVRTYVSKYQKPADLLLLPFLPKLTDVHVAGSLNLAQGIKSLIGLEASVNKDKLCPVTK